MLILVSLCLCVTGLESRSLGQLLLPARNSNELNPLCELRPILLESNLFDLPSLQELALFQPTMAGNNALPLEGIKSLKRLKLDYRPIGEFDLLGELVRNRQFDPAQRRPVNGLFDPLNLFGSRKPAGKATTTNKKPVVVKNTESASGGLLEKKLANPDVITNYFHENSPEQADHPLLPAIEVAKLGLMHGRKNIRDYSATMHKRERIGGTLMPEEVMELKIRTDRVAEGMNQSAMSVYLKFLSPSNVAGREVIWQKGRNNDRLTVHEYVLGINVKVHLVPNSSLARQGNRYPLTEIGFETLTLRMIEKGVRDCEHGECSVNVNRTSKINGRDCTMIEIVHPTKRDHFEFHIARIFIDDELNVPLRYANYSWPKSKGGEPVLEEEYTFTNIKLNSGLSDIDFDTSNPAYNFPR